MPPRTLTAGDLNRALLARQLLLERSSLSIVDAVEQIGGMQTQYAPSGYVGLWTRLRDFQRDDLTRALESHEIVQGTLHRNTIHMVSRREYWRYAAGVREARRAWWLRIHGVLPDDPTARAMPEGAAKLRAALAEGPASVKDLGGLADGFIGNLGL